MLNSLQGLQQRLQDFSIADIANAEANAQTLILRLKQVDEVITAIARLKTAANSISQSVDDPPEAALDLIGFDSLENHPQLHAIIKASKLIRLHRLMTALKAGGGHSESSDEHDRVNPCADLTSAEPLSNLANIGCVVGSQSETNEFPNVSQFDDDVAPTAAVDGDTSSTEKTISAPVMENSVVSRIPETTIVQTGTAEILDSTQFPTAQAEFETAIACEEKTDSHAAEGLAEDFPFERGESIDGNFTIPPLQHETTPPEPVIPHLDAHIAASETSPARDKTSSPIDESKVPVPTGESFDLRLLDDLVSNYGEFASSPNLPATIKKKELETFEPAADETHELQPDAAGTVETAAPMVKNNGDLDRQLKKIIKDYGEYDLYSGKPTTNIKKAGILAFVFLGLVFGGIYLFKAPPSTARTPPAASSNTTSDRQELHSAEHENQGDQHGKKIEQEIKTNGITK